MPYWLQVSKEDGRPDQRVRRETGACWTTQAERRRSFEKQMTYKRSPFPPFTQEDPETLGSQCHAASLGSIPRRSQARIPRRGLGQDGGLQTLLSFPKPQTTGTSSLVSSDFGYQPSCPVTLTMTHSRQDPSSGGLFGNISPNQLPGS